jgi:hypothetical protein
MTGAHQPLGEWKHRKQTCGWGWFRGESGHGQGIEQPPPVGQRPVGGWGVRAKPRLREGGTQQLIQFAGNHTGVAVSLAQAALHPVQLPATALRGMAPPQQRRAQQEE